MHHASQRRQFDQQFNQLYVIPVIQTLFSSLKWIVFVTTTILYITLFGPIHNAYADVTPPVISNVAVPSITGTSATITWTTDEPSSSQIEYGTTTSYGSATPLDSTLITSHSVVLNGLSAWVTYYFQVDSQDVSGNLATSSGSFTVLATPDTTSPTGIISINNGATYTTSTTVTLTLFCSDWGSGCSQIRFSTDGTTWDSWEGYAANKTWTLASGDGDKTVYVQYNDGNGNISLSYTDTITLDTTGPIISGVGTSNITDSSLSISWTTNEGATTQVEYGTTTSYGSSNTLDPTIVTDHGISLSGLAASTTYHYRVKSMDAAGNFTTSNDNTFTTVAPLDTTPPAISQISTNNITTGEATITWATDEAATSQVEYGASASYGSFSNLDNSLVTSHAVALSGRTANTVYHFRVLSVDQAGNQSTSAEYTFTTSKVLQPDTPASITDIRIRSGSSTKNSVIIDWTATGADGIEGTASLYDVRISTMKIIEDETTPNQGEINFSSATKITGISAPKIAGTTESLEVTQLETNRVYYFAIKATDEKGNISAISNVINGDSTPPLPVTALRNGYTLISFPLVPSTLNVQDLLSGIVGNPVELYWWSSNGLGDRNGSFIAENNVVPGYGYFFKSNMDNAVLNIQGTAVTDASRTTPLQPGWNMIGNTYPAEVSLQNTYIQKIDTGELKSYEDAVIAGWIGNAIYSFNGSTYDFELYTYATLKLWQGYWVATLQNGQYEIIIYKP